MKVAVVYDDLYQKGGGEYFLLCLLKVYKDPVLYTPIYASSSLFSINVVYSKTLTFIAKYFGKIGYYFASFLSVYWFESLRFAGFDLVINLSNRNSISVITPANVLCIQIITTPFRLLWEKTPKLFSNALLNPFRSFNFLYSKRSDYTFTISKYSQKKIEKYWGIKSDIVTCPYKPLKAQNPAKVVLPFDSYFLMGGRFNKWKGKYFLQVLQFFKGHPEYNLVVFGKTSSFKKEIKEYRELPNIYFINFVSDAVLSYLYKNCIAFIHPQVEDFGLTPFEALQFYKPVVALNKGGVKDYLNSKTAILYNDFSRFDIAIKGAFDYKVDRDYVNKILDLYSFKNFEYNFKKLVNTYAQKTNR